MRIAVVGNGRSVHTVTRSAAIAARGHDVRLVTAGDVLPAPGVELRTRPLPRTPGAAALAARAFFGDIHSFHPDLLHLHYAGGRLGTLALLSGVRPLVVTVMGGDVLPEQHLGGYSALERRATRRILEQADLLLVKSDALRRAIAAFGSPTARVETVRWGVEPERFHRDPVAALALRRRLRLAPADRVLLSPRILTPLYNVHLIVEAMPRILERVPEALLLVTEYSADAEYRRTLERRAAELGVAARVGFVGQFGHDEMPALYSLAEAVVMVPSSDGLPQSLFEAMACEAPVVLGRLPGYGEVVTDGESALLVEPGGEAIAGAVARLLEDGALRESIARRALEAVREKACLPREIERVVALYRELLIAPRAPKPRGGRLLDALSLILR